MESLFTVNAFNPIRARVLISSYLTNKFCFLCEYIHFIEPIPRPALIITKYRRISIDKKEK